MKQEQFMAIVAGGALIGSFVTGSLIKGTMKGQVEDFVIEAYEKEAKKLRVTIDIDSSVNEKALTKLVETYEDFQPMILDEDRTYLHNKVGFELKVEKTVASPITPDALPFGIFHTYSGINYVFQIDSTFDEPVERLVAGYYNDSTFPTTTIIVEDRNTDGIIDYLSGIDNKNNTRLKIKRNDSGKLKYEGIDKKGAKIIFGKYAVEYIAFKGEFFVDQLIADYEPKFEIRETSNIE